MDRQPNPFRHREPHQMTWQIQVSDDELGLCRQRAQHPEPQHFERRSVQAVHAALARASMAAGAPLVEVLIDPPIAGALAESFAGSPDHVLQWLND